jgi:hypothetical protein
MGAEPKEIFKEIIDAQLAAARGLMASGTPASQVYGLLSARNAAVALAEIEDKTVWSVPVRKVRPHARPGRCLGHARSVQRFPVSVLPTCGC